MRKYFSYREQAPACKLQKVPDSGGRRTLLTACFAALLPAGTARAKRSGRIRFSGRGLAPGEKHSGRTLSRNELMQCMMDAASINEMADIADKQSVKIKKMERDLNPYDEYSVNRFNDAVDEYNGLGSNMNRAVAEFNAKCAGAAYYLNDMDYVKKQLRAQGVRTDHQ